MADATEASEDARQRPSATARRVRHTAGEGDPPPRSAGDRSASCWSMPPSSSPLRPRRAVASRRHFTPSVEIQRGSGAGSRRAYAFFLPPFLATRAGNLPALPSADSHFCSATPSRDTRCCFGSASHPFRSRLVIKLSASIVGWELGQPGMRSRRQGRRAKGRRRSRCRRS